MIKNNQATKKETKSHPTSLRILFISKKSFQCWDSWQNIARITDEPPKGLVQKLVHSDIFFGTRPPHDLDYVRYFGLTLDENVTWDNNGPCHKLSSESPLLYWNIGKDL